MITQNAIGHRNQVEELLKKSMLNMNSQQIHTWMKYQFEPENMFCFWQDDRLTSCIQMKRRILTFNNQKISVSVIALAATLPDYRQRNQFGQLLEAAFEQSSHNDLMTLVYTNFPKLFESRSFQSISKTKYYWIAGNKCIKGNDKHIRFYNKSIDLYPLYKEFMSYFDGSIVLTKQQFDHKLQYEIANKKSVAIMYNDDNEIRGFAIYKVLDSHVKIDMIVYLDAMAIYDLLKYLAIRNEAISFVASQDERFEKLFPFDFPRNQGTVLVRLNNYKLFSKWLGKDVRNSKQAYQEIEKPIWNHFID